MTKARTNADNVTADISGITAGTGITGGGTSGTVTITNSMATAIDAAGDLIYGTGADTFTKLGIGSSAQVLTVASGIPSWATPAAGGAFTVLVSGSLPASTQLSLTSINQTYKNLKLYFNCGSLSANSVLTVTFNADNANVYVNSGVRTVGGVSAVYGNNTTQGTIHAATLNAASAFYTLNMDIYQYATTDNMRIIGINSGYKDTGADFGSLTGTIGFNRGTAITSISIDSSAGNFSSGSYILYGVN